MNETVKLTYQCCEGWTRDGDEPGCTLSESRDTEVFHTYTRCVYFSAWNTRDCTHLQVSQVVALCWTLILWCVWFSLRFSKLENLRGILCQASRSRLKLFEECIKEANDIILFSFMAAKQIKREYIYIYTCIAYLYSQQYAIKIQETVTQNKKLHDTRVLKIAMPVNSAR